jgi:hypothetical protein
LRVGEAVCGLGVGDGVSVSVGSGEGVGLPGVSVVAAPALSAWTTIPWAATVIAITVGRCSVGYGVGRGEPAIMLQLASVKINMTRMRKLKNLILDMLSECAQEYKLLDAGINQWYGA